MNVEVEGRSQQLESLGVAMLIGWEAFPRIRPLDWRGINPGGRLQILVQLQWFMSSRKSITIAIRVPTTNFSLCFPAASLCQLLDDLN